MNVAELCRTIAQQLAERRLKVVFAESCTAGLVSSSLAEVPGISNSLCGSAVTYRNRTKECWLGIAPDQLDDPGPVSETISQMMAARVLERTPEADLAASITGHLGPNAPHQLDGIVYVGLARRDRDGAVATVQVRQHLLESLDRSSRQHEAAKHVLQDLLRLLDTSR